MKHTYYFDPWTTYIPYLHNTYSNQPNIPWATPPEHIPRVFGAAAEQNFSFK